MSDRLKVNGSLARVAIRELATKGLIRAIATHSSQLLYTRAKEEAPKEVKTETAQAKAPKKGAAKKAAAAEAEA